MEILFQFRFLRIRDSVDSGQHLVLLAAAPICACQAQKLHRLDILRRHQMRTGTEIYEFSLLIEADLLTLRQIFNQLYLIWFVAFLKICDRLFPGLRKSLDRQILFHDLLHLCLDLLQIFRYKRSLPVQIIIETVVDRRSDSKLGIRVQTLNRLRHDMRRSMPERSLSILGIKRQQFQLTILIDLRPQVYDITVHLRARCDPCKTLADILRNVKNRPAPLVFLHRTIF